MIIMITLTILLVAFMVKGVKRYYRDFNFILFLCLSMASTDSNESVDLYTRKMSDDNLHPYMRAFWAGKFLQAQDEIQDEERQKAINLLSTWTTTLSNGVSRVILNKEDLFEQIQDSEYFNGKFLNWNKFKKSQILSIKPIQSIDEQLTSEEIDFLKASYYVKHAASSIHLTVMTWTCEQFRNYFAEVLDVFSYEQDFVDVFALHLNNESSLALMIAASYLERALGDIFEHMINSKKGNTSDKKDRVVCPRILRDLLATDELNNFLGEDLIFLLKTVIGPPIGLNLRNVLWHGFVSEKEFDSYYTSFIFVLMTSLAAQFKQLLGPNNVVPKRPLIRLNSIATELYDYGRGSLALNINEFTEDDWKFVRGLVERSFFILPERASVFIQAFTHLNSNEPLKYHRFSTLFLPQFEHSLRRIFVAVNDLPTPMLCAESRAYFTTLDILLDEMVGEGQNNRMTDEIGPGAMNCLWDLFIHVAGPRPRDRISHGEGDPATIPDEVIDRFLAVLVYFCCKYDSENKSQEYFNQMPMKFNAAYQYVNNYVSCFHPKSLLQRQFKAVSKSYNDLMATVNKFPFNERTDVDTDHENEDELYKYRRQDEFDLLNTVSGIHEQLESQLTHSAIKLFNNEKYQNNNELAALETLQCSQNEISLITSLRILLKEVDQLLIDYNNKIRELSNIISSKQASRRAQDSFYKLLGLMDLFAASFTWFIYLTEYLLLIKNRSAGQKEIKLLNRCLTYVQRLQTKVKENQWAALIDTIKEMLKTVMKRV